MQEAETSYEGIPALRCSEARLRFLLRLSDALRLLDDASEIQVVASRLLVDQLQASRVGYADLASATGKLIVSQDAVIGVRSLVGEYLIASFQDELWTRLRSGEPDVHVNVASDGTLTEAEKSAHARMEIGAVVNVPLFERGQLRAFFFLHYDRPHAFAPYEIEFLRETAERAWFAIEGARARTALRAGEARLAAAFESVPVGIAVLDPSGRTVVANSEYHRFVPGGVIPSQTADLGRWRAWDERGQELSSQDFPGARAMRGERTVPGQEMLFDADSDHQLWTRVASVPILDDAGCLTGQACVISDIDAAKRSADALRETQARTNLLIDSVAVATWEASPEGLVDVESPSWCAYTGQSFDDYKGRGWLNAIHPDDRARVQAIWQDAVLNNRLIDGEYRLRRYDGCYRWMSRRAMPLRDEAGRVTKWLGINIDIHERKQMEEALRSSERRTRAVVEGIPQLLWRADHVGEWTWASPQWSAFTGQTDEDSRGLGWLRMVHIDDRSTAMTAWRTAKEAKGFDVQLRLYRQNGSHRWFAVRAMPIQDEHDGIVEWIGTANDVDDLLKAQARQDVLVAELQHRTRNLIAVVSGLAEQTIDRSSSLDDFEQRFKERLSALGRVQALLSQANDTKKVTFDELLRAELAALGADGETELSRRVTIVRGNDIPLRSSAVQTLALAIHELATNALKHGALAVKNPNGELRIDWATDPTIDGRSALFIDWHERGFEATEFTARTARSGYGRHLVERGLPFQLGAETTYLLTEAGLHCTIRVPDVAWGGEGEIDD